MEEAAANFRQVLAAVPGDAGVREHLVAALTQLGTSAFSEGRVAAAAGRDRVEYLLDIIGPPRVIDFGKEGLKQSGPPNPKFPFDTQRLRNVIDLVAQKSGWATKKASASRALGIAAHRSFLTYVAVVADVEVGQGGAVRIPRIDIALDASYGKYPKDREIAEAIAGQLSNVGIRTTVKTYEWGLLTKRVFSHQASPLALIGWGDANFDQESHNRLTLKSGSTWSQTKDEKLDALPRQ